MKMVGGLERLLWRKAETVGIAQFGEKKALRRTYWRDLSRFIEAYKKERDFLPASVVIEQEVTVLN